MSGLVDYLRSAKQREDRATLAALRRGLGKPPGTAPEMYPHVVPYLPNHAGQWTEASHYLVAALFAAHPLDWTGEEPGWDSRNLGASMRRLQGPEASAGVERRFVALLQTAPGDLANQLRHIVSLLAAESAPVDWNQLLIDIQRWDREDREVQRRWARAFWGARASSETAGEEETTAAEE